MFVGWLREESLDDLDSFKSSCEFFDIYELLFTYKAYKELCFGAYEDEILIGMITAYILDDSVVINNFYTLKEQNDISKRLLSILLNNIDLKSKNITFLSDLSKIELFKSFGFKKYGDFSQFMHSGEAVAFNFSSKLSKQITNGDFKKSSRTYSKSVLNISQREYLDEKFANPSSLQLATQYGFLHSYAVNKKYIKISPWLMGLEAFMDAQMLLRGVLYHRGLKKIYAFVPDAIDEIVKLYEEYKFKKVGSYELLYLGAKPNIRLESVYAL